MSESRVRAAQQSDVEALAALAAETFPMACPPEITDKDIAVFVETNLSPERFRAHLDAPLHAVLVHETDEGLDGYLLMMAGDDFLPDPSFGVTHLPAAYLSKCYVRLGSHGGAVSGALLDEAKRIAADDLHVASIWLNTSQDNIRARRFYEKHGFVRVGVKTMPVGDHVLRRLRVRTRPRDLLMRRGSARGGGAGGCR